MFGKFMNNYYYGKSGKGDYTKDDLPTNRWQLFWEMLRTRLAGLCRLNLMYMIIWLPTMIVLMLGVSMFSSLVTEEGKFVENAEALLETIIQSTLLFLVPCISITGIVTPGVTYVTRNWSRDEHAFIWSDFKDAVKANWKQGLPVSIISGFLPIAVYVGWHFYGEMSQTFSMLMAILQVLVLMVGIMWALAVTYMHPLIVSYKLRFRDVIRNAFILAVARLPMSVGIRLLHCVPLAIAVALAMVVNPIYCMLGLFAYYFLFGFALSRFVTASYTNAVFDRFINSRIEGATVNRGLNTDVDDDDEDDEEEEQE